MARLTHELRLQTAAALEDREPMPVLRSLFDACRAELVPDVSHAHFADILAQTAAYALFIARCLQSVSDSPAPFTRYALARLPAPHPFLRRLLLITSGSDDGDESWLSGVDALARLFSGVDTASLSAEAKFLGDDPPTAFYEAFLRAYDPTSRLRHGVYVTPRPLVSYIVRSADALLATHFGQPDGFASPRVAGPTGARGALDWSTTRDIAVLDPACGTGAFLIGVLDHLERRVGRDEDAPPGLSPGHLRLAGCELLPVPYLIAQIMLATRIAKGDTPVAAWGGCDNICGAGIHLDLALGDALTMGNDSSFVPGTTRSARASNHGDEPLLLILGNPPYRGHSSHDGAAIAGLLRGTDSLDGSTTGSYFALDGEPLVEANLKWLNDDYVRFLRYAQWRIERAGRGILAFVTSSAFLENPTFRAMRRSLMRSFDAIYLLDLHGSNSRGARPPDGTKDASLFDTQQGVAISLFVRRAGDPGPSRDAAIYRADLRGDRASKHAWLAAHDVSNMPWSRLEPQGSLYSFARRDANLNAEYARGWSLADAMPEHSLGILTKRDALVVGFSREEVLDRIAVFADPRITDADCARRFGLRLRDRDGWDLAAARSALANDGIRPELVRPILYRPFDIRYIYHDPALIARPNRRIMRHLERENVALVVGRQGAATGAPVWDVAFATSQISDQNLFRRGGGTVFPLYLYREDDDDPPTRTPNLAPALVTDVCDHLGMAWLPDGAGDRERRIGPGDVLAYIYAVLWTPGYRARYADDLRRDFPRVPITANPALFHELCQLGGHLLALHLPDAAAAQPRPDWDHAGYHIDDIAPDVRGATIGGYRMAEKWIKDRGRRPLTPGKVAGYQAMLATLAQVHALLPRLDATIARHGGWPLE
jgi:predicted helicase